MASKGVFACTDFLDPPLTLCWPQLLIVKPSCVLFIVIFFHTHYCLVIFYTLFTAKAIKISESSELTLDVGGRLRPFSALGQRDLFTDPCGLHRPM